MPSPAARDDRDASDVAADRAGSAHGITVHAALFEDEGALGLGLELCEGAVDRGQERRLGRLGEGGTLRAEEEDRGPTVVGQEAAFDDRERAGAGGLHPFEERGEDEEGIVARDAPDHRREWAGQRGLERRGRFGEALVREAAARFVPVRCEIGESARCEEFVCRAFHLGRGPALEEREVVRHVGFGAEQFFEATARGGGGRGVGAFECEDHGAREIAVHDLAGEGRECAVLRIGKEGRDVRRQSELADDEAAEHDQERPECDDGRALPGGHCASTPKS